MKLKYIIGSLVLLLLMVGTASAATFSETFYLTEVNEKNKEQYSGLIEIKVTCQGNTITIKDVSEALNDISNVDIKHIGINLPDDYWVINTVDENNDAIKWNIGNNGSFQKADFGRFNTELNKGKNDEKSRGPIKIYLNKDLEGPLTPNVKGNSVAVHISFGEKGDRFKGSTWVSGNTPIPDTPIPEFPTIALPIAAILGLMFIFGRRKQK